MSGDCYRCGHDILRPQPALVDRHGVRPVIAIAGLHGWKMDAAEAARLLDRHAEDLDAVRRYLDESAKSAAADDREAAETEPSLEHPAAVFAHRDELLTYFDKTQAAAGSGSSNRQRFRRLRKSDSPRVPLKMVDKICRDARVDLTDLPEHVWERGLAA